MKRLSLILIYCSVICITTGFIWNMGVKKMPVRVSAKDLPDEGLLILPSSNQNFTKALAAAEIPVLEVIRPYAVILRNTGQHSVIAFALKWDLVDSKGTATTRHYCYVTAWALEGQQILQRTGNIIRPGSDWLFAPGFAVELKNASTISSTYLARIAKDMSQFTSITASLDGAFFDDGNFVGPNTSQFFDQVITLQKARLDVLKDLSLKSKKGTPEGAFGDIELLTRQPKIRLGKKSTVDDYYNRFKADFADDLMAMKRVSGVEKTLDHHLLFLKRQWPELKKKS